MCLTSEPDPGGYSPADAPAGSGEGPPLLVLGGSCAEGAATRSQLDFLGVASLAAPAGELAARLQEDTPLLGVLLLGAEDGTPPLGLQMEQVAGLRPDLPVLLCARTPDPTAAEARNHRQYAGSLAWPVRYQELVALLRDLRLIHAQGGLADDDGQLELFRSLVGQSAGIGRIRKLIRKVAPAESTILILGETGTGKEVVARNIHYHSAGRNGPFVAINCGAIPPDLLESELFGHEKGAFTGALSQRKGRFELAAGGTLFLDEIGDMRLDMQVKLLRVLQEYRFERLGGTRSIEADVRIVAATHRDLEQMIGEGRFREDLYYRLNVMSIEMPPLRERKEDLPLLISELNARLQRRGQPAACFSADALRLMAAYDWPGNVRELANLVERCAILSPDIEVPLEDLPWKLRRSAPAAEEGRAAEPVSARPLLPDLGLDQPLSDAIELTSLLENLEVQLIRQALERSNGVVARAARALGLRRTTLVEKLRKFGIERDGQGASQPS